MPSIGCAGELQITQLPTLSTWENNHSFMTITDIYQTTTVL
jgi:hypothetical protein